MRHPNPKIIGMSGPPEHQRRKPLGDLDPNRDLNAPRALALRSAITYDKENIGAVIRGIRTGVYNLDEVLFRTDPVSFPLPVPNEEGDAADNDLVIDPMIPPGRLDDSIDDELEYADEADYDEMMGNDLDEDIDEDMGEDHDHDDVEDGDEHINGGLVFDPAALGLREINNLAHFGVSSHKPGNGVEELLSDDLDKYWQ